MFRYHDLPTHTTEVLDLTSLTVDEFTALVPPFEDAFLAYMAEWTLHGRLFGMRQSKATQWIHVLLPVVRNTLRTLGDAPCRHVEVLREQLGVTGPSLLGEASPAAEVPAVVPSAPPPFCHDGTKRPIPRPHDATEQKACYSGKKRRHMLKNLLLINRTTRILFLSETVIAQPLS